MNKYRKELNQIEHERSFEFVDYPEYQKYYSKQISPDFKKPKKIIVTEIYDEIIPKNKLGRSEYYDYYTESPSPYNNYYRYHKMAKKKYGSQDKNYYLTSRKDRNLNSNFNDNYSEYNKQLYFGDIDLREEYNSPSNIRANIRRKVHRGSNTPEPMRNYYTLKNNEDFLENFQYHESKNIKDKNNKKYQSITRVIGYSNLIPLNYNTNENNLTNVSIYRNRNYNQNLDNISLSRYNNLNRELYTNVDYNNIDYNKYQINEEQKSTTPQKITRVNYQKEIKNYEIPKESQTSINNSNVQITTSKYESQKFPQTKSNISKISTSKNKDESIKLPTTTTTEIVKETRKYESLKKPENITTTSVDDILKKYDLPRNRPTTQSIKPTYKTNIDTNKYNNNIITKKTEKKTTTTTSVDDILKKYELPNNTTTIPTVKPSYKVNIDTSKYNNNKSDSTRKKTNITTTSVENIIQKYELPINRATTPSIRPTFKVNIDTSKYNTNSNSNKYRTSKTTEKVTTTTTSVDDILKKYDLPSNRPTTPSIKPTFKVNIDTNKYNTNSNSNKYISTKTTEKVTTTTTSVDDILKKYNLPSNRATTPSIKPTFRANIDTSKYNTNSSKKSIGSYKYKSDISESNIIDSRKNDFNGAKNISTLEVIEKNKKIKEKKEIPNISNITISKITKTINKTDNLPNLSRNNNRFDSLKLNNYNSLSNNNLKLNEKKITKTITEVKKIDTDNSYKPKLNIEPYNNHLSNIKINENITKTLTETKKTSTNNGLNKAYKSNIDIKNIRNLNKNYKNNLKIYTYNQDVNLETSKSEYNNIEFYNNEFNNNEFIDMNARTATSRRYNNSISEEKYNNKNIGYYENKEINKIEIKKKKK